MAKKKQTAEMHIGATFKGREGEIDLYHIVDAEKIKQVPKEQLEKDTMERLKVVSPTPTSGIFRTVAHFSMVEADALSEFSFGSVIVEAHLPYCLHLPNSYEMTVDLPDRKIEALVSFQKVWTKRAEEDGVKSDDVDFYAADTTTYFQKSTMRTPIFPVRPEEGWDQYFTGRNIERMKDQNGTFRYSRLFIQFDPNISEDRLAALERATKEEGEAVFDEIADIALAVVNRVIDCYRHVTRQEYVERLGVLSINTVYLKKQNQGLHIMGLVPGIESAMMNRSKKEIDEIERLLKDGEPVPLHDLLVLDAHSAFQRKAFTLAIVESFQALEIMLENYLVAAFKAKGVSQADYEAKLDKHWKTKERLNLLLKEVKGHALNENAALWDPWHIKYDKVRNEVIHQGKSASAKETEGAMKANEAVMAWLHGLS